MITMVSFVIIVYISLKTLVCAKSLEFIVMSSLEYCPAVSVIDAVINPCRVFPLLLVYATFCLRSLCLFTREEGERSRLAVAWRAEEERSHQQGA